MRKFKIGIIGFGFMGKMHTYNYRTLPLYYSNLPFKVTLRGICDTVKPAALYAKEMLGFDYATDKPEDIFSDPEIDIVDICTPNLFHKDNVLRALEAGKNIYCDKPLATGYPEAKEIADKAAESGVITQMALQYRCYPVTMRAKELIEEGKLGRILSFRASYLHSGSVDPNKPIGWKQDKKMGGGGVLFDLGSHVIDLMYYLMGGYSSLITDTEIIYKQRPDRNGRLVDIDADDAAFLIAKMKNGATGTIEASKIATGANDEMRFEIHGVKGSVRANLMDPNWLEFYDNTVPDAPLGGVKGYTKIECVQRFRKPGGDFPSSKFAMGWTRAHAHSLYNFLSCVYENRKAAPSFEDAAYIQYIMEKAYESDSRKQWVTV